MLKKFARTTRGAGIAAEKQNTNCAMQFERYPDDAATDVASRRTETNARCSLKARASELTGVWSFLVRTRADYREELTPEQSDCLETAAKSIARFLNISVPRTFQEHLRNLPQDFPLVM
jgi:hypothetical protein